MKILYIILILLNITFISKSQDTVKRNVTLLRESSKIDSLISSLIHLPMHLKSPKNDSCILLGLTKNRDDCFVSGLRALNHRTLIFDFGGNLKESNKLGYFEFKGYLIFVFGDSFMDKFFRYTKAKKSFVFVEPKVKDYITLTLFTGYMSWAVSYNDGNLHYGVH